jgi:hypothetical protein
LGAGVRQAIIEAYGEQTLYALGGRSNPLKNDSDTLADADAHGADGVAALTPVQLVDCGQREARAAHAERVAERDGAAVRIDVRGIVRQA